MNAFTSPRFLYLTVDFLALVFPLLFSFHPRNNFYRKWKFLWPAIALPAILFIGWDIWFTAMGVWGFNPNYITGVYFFNLPLEEVLFFFCVPYASVFTYESVTLVAGTEKVDAATSAAVSDGLAIGLILAGGFYYDRLYTSITFITTGFFIAYLARLRKVSFMGRFYFAFLFILIPFFIINGLLTGTGIDSPVVWYRNTETMRLRIGTIPAEDVFYGMLLLLMNVALFDYFQKKAPLRPAQRDRAGPEL